MIFDMTRRYRGVLSLAAALTLLLTMWAGFARSEGRAPFPRPDSHKGAWIDSHGIEARVRMNEAGQEGSPCLTCHEKNDCIVCHATRPPKDHTNYWRTTGHGLTASVNRERCLTCHRQDYCVRCHNETAPRSHTAGWINRHCQYCHAAGKAPGGNCGVCHKTSPH